MWSDYMVVSEYNIEMEKVLWIGAGGTTLYHSPSHNATLFCSYMWYFLSICVLNFTIVLNVENNQWSEHSFQRTSFHLCAVGWLLSLKPMRFIFLSFANLEYHISNIDSNAWRLYIESSNLLYICSVPGVNF